MSGRKFVSSLVLVGALVMGGMSRMAFAAEANPAEDKISGTFGVDFSTHFISYGYDVWGGGEDFVENPTVNPYAEIVIDFDIFALKFGTWWDVNNNVNSAIGGPIQEVDVYIGVVVPVWKFKLSATYQEWYYGGQTEKVFDFGASFDDSEYLGAWALNPSINLHVLTAGGDIPGVKDNGVAVVLSIAPGLTVLESSAVDVKLSFPISVVFGDSDFYADGGFAYFSAGVAVAVPLKFIPSKYGAWTFSASLVLYHTDDDAIPTNPDETFLTGKFGFSVGF